jgi:hypothetical protein
VAGVEGQGDWIASGACCLTARTIVEVFRKPKVAWPAMTVPTQVPCGLLRRLVADGSLAPGTKFSPPITVSRERPPPPRRWPYPSR